MPKSGLFFFASNKPNDWRRLSVVPIGRSNGVFVEHNPEPVEGAQQLVYAMPEPKTNLF
jgi:hypothetical protein